MLYKVFLHFSREIVLTSVLKGDAYMDDTSVVENKRAYLAGTLYYLRKVPFRR